MKTFLHLEFGQLSQLLGSIEDELSALEERERGGRGEGEREGGEAEGGGEGVVIVEAIVGSSKRLSVTQRTPTSLTLPFINTHSKPLYGCHCTFVLPSKVPLSHLSAIISFFRNITRTNKVKHFCERERGGGGVGRKGVGERMAQLIVKGQERKKVKKERERDKVVHSWTHTDTVTRSLEVVWRAGVYIACRFLSTPCLRVDQIWRWWRRRRQQQQRAAALQRCQSRPSVECRVPKCITNCHPSHFGWVKLCPSLAVIVCARC